MSGVAHVQSHGRDAHATQSHGLAARATAPAWLMCIDVETTGLEPARHGLLSIGAFHPASGAEFYVECAPRAGCVVDAEALRVNGQDIYDAWERVFNEDDAVRMLVGWLRNIDGVGKFALVGKNPAFDRDWLVSRIRGIDLLFMRRMIDVHSCALAVAAARGVDVPGMSIDEVYAELGLPVESRPHHALKGALFAWWALVALGEMAQVWRGNHGLAARATLRAGDFNIGSRQQKE